MTGYQYLASSGTDPQGNCTATTYDPSGNQQYSYEGSPLRRQLQRFHRLGLRQGRLSGRLRRSSCGGPNGVLCSVREPNGNTTTYGYDTKGNVTSVTPPAPQSAETLTYDSLSRVASITDGDGNKTTYTYDAMDRLTQVLYCGTGTCPTPCPPTLLPTPMTPTAT